MDSKKRDFHDLSEDEKSSENEDQVQEDSRFQAFPKKKRRLSSESDRGRSTDSDDDHGIQDGFDSKEATSTGGEHSSKSKAASHKLTPLTPAQLKASQRKAKKTGVVYISRVPPFMKPATLRKLLSPYGEIGRIFLTPEPTPAYKKRVRAGGNKKKSFVDGWVEFVSKKSAKECVEMLNGNLIGGKKSGFYHDDIWNLKYLRGFKWSDLMEQVQVEDRMREGKLRAELERESKERKAFMTNIGIAKHEKSLGLDGDSEAQLDRERSGGDNSTQTTARPASGTPRVERRFKQRNVQSGKKTLGGSEADSVNRVLRNIF